MVTVIIFLLILSVLIIVHELGHFITAKKVGIIAEEFGIGLPPRLKKLFTWQKTDFTLNWLPLGGFVRMKGEDPSVIKEILRPINQRSGEFWAQKPIKRMIVISAGVVMNVLFAVVAFSVVYTSLGIPEVGDEVTIEAIVPSSPAQTVGLKTGDILVDFASPDEFLEYISQNRGREIILTIKRSVLSDQPGEILSEIKITPRTEAETPEGEGSLGIVISNLEMIRYPWWQMPFRAAVVGLKEAIAWGGSIISGLGNMLAQFVLRGEAPSDVAGPIGIAQLTGQVASQGWLSLIQFSGVLSINLAIINFLPIPALDGGRMMFLLVEIIRGRPVNPRKERWAHLAGYVILISLLALVTIQDILRLLQG